MEATAIFRHICFHIEEREMSCIVLGIEVERVT